ncbi:MAG: glycosyltransferase [Pirellulales bacterium]
MLRVAVIFDHLTRPETTGLYCFRALSRLCEVEQFHPDEMGTLARSGIDLYLFVDDGLEYPLPTNLHPSAFWAIDTHLDLQRTVTKSLSADLVFAAQRRGVEDLRRSGVPDPIWLPLACDPEIHCRHRVPKCRDICFIGNVLGAERIELLRLLQRRFPNCHVDRQYFEEMARSYSESKLVFNRSVRDDLNMRVFEALATGSMLLTNDSADGQAELFQDGVHLATYRDAEELIDKANYYLTHDEARERIAKSGEIEATGKHTYHHRMQSVIDRLSKRTISVGASERSVFPLKPSDGLDPAYFGHVREELLDKIPESARVVLDVGCGMGRLGEAIKKRQPCLVWGIELNSAAAQAARARLDRVWTGDIEQLEVEFQPNTVDVVVFGDVLEHLRDPLHVLRRARTWLKPGGIVVASVPNVAHHSVIRSLLAGNWTYESAGLLDETHVKFFTRREIRKLFFRGGFDLCQLSRVQIPGDELHGMLRSAERLAIGNFSVANPRDDLADDLATYQYLIVASTGESVSAQPSVRETLTSIIIPTFNQFQYTRLCLESIRRYTDEPLEIIVVDNGSTDQTRSYLAQFPDIRTILNESNLGFPKAVNQGIQVAHGAQFLLLNNDCIVTTGWLRRMLEALDRDPRVGLVGPVSNNVSGLQQIQVDYDDLAQLDGFAWDWSLCHCGQNRPVDRLVGFCLLIRRTVIERIGLFDERFGIGNFEDDDFCRRATQAGHLAVIALDSFVHHFGSKTFRGGGFDHGKILVKNRKIYEEKWAETGPSANPVALDPPVESPGASPAVDSLSCRAFDQGGLELVLSRSTVSLCMIVRDSAATLGAALASIRPWVDEIVVVDTGSTDETMAIAASFGAHVAEFPWCDDFSKARNVSLQLATGDWVFWMDSDDTIDPHNGAKLRQLVNQNHAPQVLGYVFQVHCPHDNEDDTTDVTVVDHVKLFRNQPQLRFEGRIHEQILGAISAAGGQVVWTDVFVVHSGSDRSAAGVARKLQRDMRLLRLEEAERPDHPFTHFNLGMTLLELNEPLPAICHLQQSLALSGPRESHRRKAYALLIEASLRLKDFPNAAAHLACGQAEFPEDPELWFRSGVLANAQGQLELAIESFQRAIDAPRHNYFRSFDVGVLGHKARQNLAAVFVKANDLGRAAEQWRAITLDRPDRRSGWLGLAEVLFRQGNHDELRRMVSQMANQPQLGGLIHAIQIRLDLELGQPESARHRLDLAERDWPTDRDVLEARCRYLFEHGPLEDALAAQTKLVDQCPDDGAAQHNLGLVLLRLGRLDPAVVALQKAARLRPDHTATHLHLGNVLEQLHRTADARRAWVLATQGPIDDPCRAMAIEKLSGSRGSDSIE